MPQEVQSVKCHHPRGLMDTGHRSTKMDSELGLGDQCGQELCMGRGKLVQQGEKRDLEESWIKESSRSSSSRLPLQSLRRPL